MMKAKAWPTLAALSLACIVLLSACAASGPGRRPDLPRGVAVGRIFW